MTYLSDTLTIGLVIILLFGSIVLYLYTCIQQSEQKISLLESILLDIKMSGEIKGYSELPADEVMIPVESSTQTSTVTTALVEDKPVEEYKPFTDAHEEEQTSDVSIEMEELEPLSDATIDYHSVIADAVEESQSGSPRSEMNYESMTLKELQSLAKSRSITGAGSMKKNSIIEALKTTDRIVKPGSAGSNSFLETSSMVSGDESA
jgi:hypothetical protein